MQEVSVQVRFIRPCLGSVKRRLGGDRTVFAMPRDYRGRIVFPPAWWNSLMSYAAKVHNLGHRAVRRIDWDSILQGDTHDTWRRVVVPASRDRKGRARYALHEAFLPGAVVTVCAVLPSELTVDDFTRLLTTAGTYRGVSPFRADDEHYGVFEVVCVERTRGKTTRDTDSA
jgi:hypothetical protein